MAGVNRVILIGNLTRDPQLKYLPSQMAVAEFGLATNRKFKSASGEDREDVCFVDCAAFGRTGEIINQYCQKGKQIYIEGRLKYDQWEDKQGGGKRSKLSVVVENFQFLGARDSGGAPPSQGGGSEDQTRPSARPPQPQRPAPPPAQEPPAQEPPFGDERQFDDKEIPF
ncbi:MAG: single-stranded DNA-binding protein [Tepidisphaeraceae bacterium]